MKRVLRPASTIFKRTTKSFSSTNSAATFVPITVGLNGNINILLVNHSQSNNRLYFPKSSHDLSSDTYQAALGEFLAITGFKKDKIIYAEKLDLPTPNVYCGLLNSSQNKMTNVSVKLVNILGNNLHRFQRPNSTREIIYDGFLIEHPSANILRQLRLNILEQVAEKRFIHGPYSSGLTVG